MLARAPQFAPASKRLAVLFTDQFNDQQKAWDFATKAKQALGQDTELSTILGKIAYRRGDYRSALRFLQEGNQGQPDDAERLFFQGMAHFGLKDTNASKKALGRALTLSPDAPFAAEAKKTLTALK
jgi:Flp pilus assembly protein TadD